MPEVAAMIAAATQGDERARAWLADLHKRTNGRDGIAAAWANDPDLTDSQAQQAWADGMTDDQREAYEDGIARRRAEREAQRATS